MASYSRAKIVAEAKKYIGCKQGDSQHKDIIDTYNAQSSLPRGYKMTYTDAWCAAFVSAIFLKLGYESIMPTECSVPYMLTACKNKGIWKESDSYVPSQGDIIFYDWQDSGSGDNTGSPDHVGIVEKVSGTTITVIEGNYSTTKTCARRTIQVNGKYIRGFACPKYTSTSSTSTTSTTSTSSKPTYKKGTTYTTQVILKVRKGAGTNYAQKTYSQLTASGKKSAYTTGVNKGCLKKGTKVTCLATKTISGNIWMQIPSGWVAAYYDGKTYVK